MTERSQAVRSYSALRTMVITYGRHESLVSMLSSSLLRSAYPEGVRVFKPLPPKGVAVLIISNPVSYNS